MVWIIEVMCRKVIRALTNISNMEIKIYLHFHLFGGQIGKMVSDVGRTLEIIH